MTVRGIVPNIAAAPIEAVRDFRVALFDLDVVMDLGWIATLAPDSNSPAQLSFAAQGGSGAPVLALLP